MTRNPVKDAVAFVGVGSTGFSRATSPRSRNLFAVEAATRAIRDAGLRKQDIDGVVGMLPAPHWMASALGLPAVTHHSGQPMPLGFAVIDAMNAVYAGSAECVLVYHSTYRTPAASSSAAKDPFRRRLGLAGMIPQAPSRVDPESLEGSPGYAAWTARYFHEYGDAREALGRIAVNGRTNAMRNELAAMRTPMTMDDYLAARLVWEPFCLFDMDVPVDGADAFVVTTAERARDLPHPSVLIHAATAGIVDRPQEDQTPGLDRHGQHVVAATLRAKSDLWLDDVDVLFPYDGFTFITLSWLENLGWCKPGEGPDFIAEHWDAEEGRILIGGRVPVNTHGGGLSEGGTQGSGHIREAVTQLRGAAGERQVAGARTALVTPGGFFFNAQGLVLRAAD